MSYVEYTDYPLSRVFEDPDEPGRYIALCDSDCTNLIVFDKNDETVTVLFEARWRCDHGLEYDSYTYSPVDYQTFEEIVGDEYSIGEKVNRHLVHTNLSLEYDLVNDNDYERYAEIGGW